MSTERVIPGGTKAEQDITARIQSGLHLQENGSRIVEVLESVEGKNNINLLFVMGNKLTVGDLAGARYFQNFLTDVKANHLIRMLGDLGRFLSKATAKIQDRFAFELAPDVRPKQYLEFAFSLVGMAVHVGGDAILRESFEDMVAERSTYEAHRLNSLTHVLARAQ